MKMARVSFLVGMMVCLILSASAASAVPRDVIKQAQENLYKLGYYNEKIDGIFGRNTKNAVMKYQFEEQLLPTGLLDKTTIKYLNRPTIILNTQNFAPFHYQGIQKSDVDGPIPQIIQLICREAGINCRIKLYENWGKAQEDVMNGIADGIFVIAWNSSRSKWLHRSTALFETEYGMFVRADDDLQFDKAIENPSVIDGYTVGVYGPSGTSKSLERLKVAFGNKGVTFDINMTADDKPLFKKLAQSEGKYAVYTNRLVGESILRGMNLSNIRFAGQHRRLSYYVGFSKESVPEKLVKKFNDAYASLISQGRVVSIMANHSLYLSKSLSAVPDSETMKPVQRFDLLNLQGDSVVKDSETCLMWQQSGAREYHNFRQANAYIRSLNKNKHAGFSDWRLPVIDELSSLMEQARQDENQMFIKSIFDPMQESCWSADKTGMDIQFADFYEGELSSVDQSDTNFVRAVRGKRCDKNM